MYRDIPVFISGSDEQLPSSAEVPDLMTQYLEFANNDSSDLEKIARIHYDFVKIHPFTDGNGRLARLLMNIYLIHAGYLPIIFPIVTRLEYIRSL